MKQVFSAKVNAHLLTNEDNPAVYVGTYQKYNEGSLFGAWLDLLTFESYEEFISICHAVHFDERDPEFMIQDYMNFDNGHGISSEWLDRKTFEHVNALADYDAKEQDVIKEFWHEVDNDLSPSEVLEKLLYVGDLDEFAYEMAEDWLDSICFDRHTAEAIRPYFDYNAYARDLSFELSVTSNYIFQL